jgi:ABC-type transport system involved in Fe-S cluster assembly fused permease/ATPase subunit
MRPPRAFTPPDKESRSPLETLATLAPYLWPEGRPDLKVRVFGAMGLLVLAKIANVYVPFLYKYAVDNLSGPQQAFTVAAALVVAYGMARVLAQSFGELRDWVFAKVAQHAVRRIALSTFEHLHRLSLRFHLERQTGGLSRVIERGTTGIQFVLRFMLFNILPTILEILLVVGIFLNGYGWGFAVAVVLTIAGYVVFTIRFTEWRTKYLREMNRRDEEANTRAVDSLLNYETVKYFGNEPHEARRLDRALAHYETAAVQSSTTLSMLNVGQGAIISAGLIAMMAMAAHGISAGTMTIGDFVMVNAFLIQLYQPLNMLGFGYREIRQGLINMENMFATMAVPPEVVDPPGAPPLHVQAGTVEFRDVHFAYDQRRPILKGVSFLVPGGRTVAIVGASGAGKSTVSRILFRFYDIASGSVTIDGQEISAVTQASVRSAIGIVPQDTVLFNDTIRYNIRYGRPDATDAEVEEAARLAQIDTFIAGLPDGYNSMVGERGLKLSGGEKQRVAIARAILKNPRIMIFDEATSALDSHTEKEIQASLREVAEHRTALVIAHRLSTVVDADEIIVLERGQIGERGRHAELLARNGLYAAMWRRQQEAADAERRLAELKPELASPGADEPELAPAGRVR